MKRISPSSATIGEILANRNEISKKIRR